MSAVNELTIFTTPTCGPCRAVKTRFEKAGLPLTIVDLTENPEILADLKRRLDVPQVQTPLFEWKDQLGTIIELRDFEAELKAELELAA